ncbi:MAG: S-layer homology domain-containing protein, partial [Actinomycetota bacterium]
MRRLALLLLLTITLLALAGTPALAQADANRVDWGNRTDTDVRLPSGWRLTACEGDAPVLCAANPGGVVDGTILFGVSDLTSASDISRSAVEADVDSFHDVFEEDRLTTCGPGYRFDRDPLVDIIVGGQPGYRFGFTVRDGGGNVMEKAVIHLAFAEGQEYAMNTSFTEPAGCPGADPNRIEFPAAAMSQVLPHLDQVAADMVLPTDFGVAPTCTPSVAPTAFTDIEGNAHQHLIHCLSRFGIVKGISTTEFGPGRTITRAQLASLVVRMLERFGEELPMPATRRFTDTAGSVHADAVERLAAAGILHGTSYTKFSPNRAATRAEATTLVVRGYDLVLGIEMYNAGVEFDDVSGTHARSISKAATSGLVFGTDVG